MGLRKIGQLQPLHAVQPREHERDAQGLLAQLHEADATRRRWAARDLVQHPSTAAALCARLGEEGDAQVREALFTSLVRIGGAVAAAGLVPLLRSEDAALRNGAIEALAQLPQDVAPHVDALLGDADPDVRIFAVNLLGALAHPRVPAWVVQVLQHEREPNVVGAALEVAVEAAGAEALPALRALPARFPGDPFIGFAAQLALQRVGAAG